MTYTKVLNPEWEDAPYEEVYFWSDMPKWEKEYYEKCIKTRRFKDPEGKIEVPKYIIQVTP